MKQERPEVILEEIAPGIWGRTIPPEELKVTPEQVEGFIKQNGYEGRLADFIYKLYKVKPPQRQ